MTKEELKQEAEKFARTEMSHPNEYGQYYCTFLKVAEPREKQIERLSKEVDDSENMKATLESQIAELKAEVKEWKDKADLWCKTANLKDHNIMINKELEKENAELKGLVNQYKASKCGSISLVNRNMIMFDQLNKAKELLKRLLITSCNSDVLNLLPNCSEVLRVRVEAEQFLSEVEK